MLTPPQDRRKGPLAPPLNGRNAWHRQLLALGGPSALNVVRGFLPMATQAIVAFLVLRDAGPHVWGQFVSVSIALSILLHVAGFGNRDYLLQRFALEPLSAFSTWRHNLISRIPLLAGSALIALVLFYKIGFWFPLLWLLAGFSAQSVEASILHHRRIIRALGAELLPAAALVAWVTVHAEGLSAQHMVAAFALATAIKALLLVCIGLPPRPKPASNHRAPLRSSAVLRESAALRASAPFFLIGLGGLLHSRIDLFLVTALANDTALASYQISINLLIAAQAAFALLLAPNARTLQTLPHTATIRLAAGTLLSGTLVLVLAVHPMASWILRSLYGLDLPPLFLWVGMAVILPVWITSLFTYYLLGKERQTSLVYLSYGGALCNALVTALLLPRLGILGALMGTAIASWTTMIGTFWLARNARSGSA